jgi:Domain of unknown function (DUF4270)
MALGAITTISLLYSCTKLDTTVLGDDLLTVDNVNTFADTLEVNTTQGIFAAGTGFNYDSTLQARTDIQYLGNLGSLPELYNVKTNAAIYVQLKPTFFPFYFGNAGDTTKGIPTVGLDSVVLCLSPRSIWGDSTSSALGQTIEVKAVSDTKFRDKTDSLFGLRFSPLTTGPVLGSITLTPQNLNKWAYFGKPSARDSVFNQVRIKLNLASFTNPLFLQDSSSLAIANNAFLNDSIFRRLFNGFEIKSTSVNGNTLYGFSLADGKTRLEFHYRKRSNTGVRDTVMQAFFMANAPDLLSGVKSASSVTNFIKRDYSSSSVVAGPSTNNMYLINAPGTYINVNIPDLTAYRNKKDKIIHRAYLQIDQNDAPNTSKFTAPPYLYLDLIDSLDPNKHKPVYFDLNSQILYNPDATFLNPLYHPYPSGSIEVGSIGGRALDRVDGGVGFKRYEINITRYVQHINANNFYNYDLRVMAPYNYFYPQYLGNQYIIPFYNPLATGSLRVGAGTYPLKTPPRRMKFIVVFSKVK